MTRIHFRNALPSVRALVTATAVAAALALPTRAAAQATARVAADPPSRSVETLRQHDSLVVHFVRKPKSKPATVTATAGQSKKAAAAAQAATAPARVVTPVVTRGAAKNRQ